MTLAEKWKEEGREEVRTLAEQWKEEGREEVRTLAEQFREEGKQQGEVALLKICLTQRFGPLGTEYIAKLECASSEWLLGLGQRILSAQSLDEVFEG